MEFNFEHVANLIIDLLRLSIRLEPDYTLRKRLEDSWDWTWAGIVQNSSSDKSTQLKRLTEFCEYEMKNYIIRP